MFFSHSPFSLLSVFMFAWALFGYGLVLIFFPVYSHFPFHVFVLPDHVSCACIVLSCLAGGPLVLNI